MAKSPNAVVTAASPAGVTLCRRIADDLERAIATRLLAAGERLPGEVEIAAPFGVNRHTVRRALAALARRGLVRPARARGTLVDGGRLAYPTRAATRVTAALADAIDAARLDIAPGRPLLVVESIDVAPDGTPIVTSTARFAADRVELMVEY